MKVALIVGLCCVMLAPASIPTPELLGRFDPGTHEGFVRIAAKYTTKPEIYMRGEAYAAFERMHAAAKLEGVNLVIVSATRNFDYQKGIWERKWKRPQYMGWQDLDKVKDIMRYSSMPGTSRHHWGTDVDFNHLENDWFTKGEGKKLYDWLQANAGEYGFAQTYTSKASGRTGYEEEKWHWSYLPLAKGYLEAYTHQVRYSDISGFNGASQAEAVRAIEDFVCGIDE